MWIETTALGLSNIQPHLWNAFSNQLVDPSVGVVIIGTVAGTVIGIGVTKAITKIVG